MNSELGRDFVKVRTTLHLHFFISLFNLRTQRTFYKNLSCDIEIMNAFISAALLRAPSLLQIERVYLFRAVLLLFFFPRETCIRKINTSYSPAKINASNQRWRTILNAFSIKFGKKCASISILLKYLQLILYQR